MNLILDEMKQQTQLLTKIMVLLNKTCESIPGVIPEESNLLTVSQVAKKIKKSPLTVRRYIKNKALKAIKPKGNKQNHYLIEKNSLDQFLRSNKKC